MALETVGLAAGFRSNEWKMDDRSGVSHKLGVVSAADDVFEVILPEDVFNALGRDERDALTVVGQPVRLGLRASISGRERNVRVRLSVETIEFLTLDQARSEGLKVRLYGFDD